jgi:hypothetical protein
MPNSPSERRERFEAKFIFAIHSCPLGVPQEEITDEILSFLESEVKLAEEGANLVEKLPIGTLIPVEVSKAHFSTNKWWRKSSLHIWRGSGGRWSVQYENPQTGVRFGSTTGKTLNEAAEKMFAYLKAQGLLTHKER